MRIANEGAHPDAPVLIWAAEEGNLEGELQGLMEGDESKFKDDPVPDALPILPLRNTVLFPGVIIPITVARDKSIQLVREAVKATNKLIGVLPQRNPEEENPGQEDLYAIGTLASIVRMFRMPDGSVTIVVQGRSRFELKQLLQTEPYFRAEVQKLKEQQPPKKEALALIHSLKTEAARIIELSPKIPSEANNTLQNINSLGFLVHFIASNLNLEVDAKQLLLETPRMTDRAKSVLRHMSRELQVLELSEEIQSKVRTDLDKQQRDYILRQQMKTIQDELGEAGVQDEWDDLRARAEKKKWPQAAQEVFAKEITKLQRTPQASPEYGVIQNYLDWLLDLPWQDYSPDQLSLKRALRQLDKDHYGLSKIKDRILEYLAVRQLRKDPKAPILCFVGPPGVGKTSLGRSIAEAMGRSFLRISLGGVRDEAEIRGHRRTYIGAMPGRIIQGLKKAKTGNPVVVLDELDKVGSDFRGDPASALLEVLDPEQNHAFNDHYLEVDYDLSRVMFIATANTLDTIHPALRDRLEVIELTGYTVDEKMHIARRFLLPKALADNGLPEKALDLGPTVLQPLIEGYTRESGVRQLGQKLNALARGLARRVVESQEKKQDAVGTATTPRLKLKPADLETYLGMPRYTLDAWQNTQRPGVAVGLAWTPVGGEILYIETLLMKGRGQFSVTGQLGEVMKESAQVAHVWLKAYAEKYSIPEEAFAKWDVHIHIPAGGIPKDGPSAGITLLTAMASLLTQRPVMPRLAMTGEITLRGKVLPVGGVQEKLLAARRAGMTTVLLADQNRKDVAEIPTERLQGLTLHYVTDMDQVLSLALEAQPVESALDLRTGGKPRRTISGLVPSPQALS